MQSQVPAAAGDRFGAQLEDVRSLASTATRAWVWGVVQGQARALSDVFYDAMFRDPEASAMLDHAVVNDRLHVAMRRWLVQLFDVGVPAAALSEVQRRTGEVHARIGVPMSMVSRGARVLKRTLLAQLAAGPLDRETLLQAAQYVEEMLGLAIEEMANSFSLNASRLTRSDEAYRIFFLGRDMKAERERRRSELLEWGEQALDRHFWLAPDDQAPGREPSSFSLWLHHKAAILFEGAVEVEQLQHEMQLLEHDLLPRVHAARTSHEEARPLVAEFRRRIVGMKRLLVSLFDRYVAIGDGRDSVTSLLNRRYFPAIARREIELAQAHHSAFSVLMIDIDRFRDVASAIGADASQVLLAQVAALLQDHVRSGDFVFRLGDDEFLALLVECGAEAAQRIGEGLRRSIEALRFDSRDAGTVSLTVSVGIAVHDGHPDYQRLLDRADAGLRQAKQEGRNRCVLAA